MAITSASFLSQLESPSMPTGNYHVTVDGQNVWFRVKRRSSPAVIFTFQGTIDRAVTAVPVFGTDLSGSITNATLIGVSDPALDMFPAPLGSGWYAGWSGCNLQEKLGAFFPQIAESVGATRIIFQGSSAGGFAALYYSNLIDNSIAVALNPQTSLDAYEYTDNYRNACWPSLGSGLLSSVIDCNLVSKYAGSFDNHVIYIQNITDTAHMKRQLAPFAETITDGKYWRFVPKTVFFGEFGHKAIPTSLWVPWVQAAVDADQSNATSVLTEMGTW